MRWWGHKLFDVIYGRSFWWLMSKTMMIVISVDLMLDSAADFSHWTIATIGSGGTWPKRSARRWAFSRGCMKESTQCSEVQTLRPWLKSECWKFAESMQSVQVHYLHFCCCCCCKDDFEGIWPTWSQKLNIHTGERPRNSNYKLCYTFNAIKLFLDKKLKISK